MVEQIAISISNYFVLLNIVKALLLSYLLQQCVERWRKRLQTRARGCLSAAVVKEWTARFVP
jgi:peptidoglycan/LPS O-acetylase OafA/YrhL